MVTQSTPTWAAPNRSTSPDPLHRSVLAALAYADLFDYPLTADEITRYQIETSFSKGEIAAYLDASPCLRSAVSRQGELYCLSGRESIFDTRRNRGQESRRIWRRAITYARIVAMLPFVRMVAVTGALAVDNIGLRPDIDLLVVTTPGRVWISRRLVVAVVRLARMAGDELCPNYIISISKLDLDQKDLFTAHELAQMVPLYGDRVYRRMLSRNDWALTFLPMAYEMPRPPTTQHGLGRARRALERALGSKLFDGWERWELVRLQRKLRPLVGDAAEVICSPEQCKGHTGLHRQWVTSRYAQRLQELGI